MLYMVEGNKAARPRFLPCSPAARRKTALDSMWKGSMFHPMTTTAEVSEVVQRLAEMLEQVRAGNEVILTQQSKPVARLVPPLAQVTTSSSTLRIGSLKGHRVLSPVVSQAELADELFGPQ